MALFPLTSKDNSRRIRVAIRHVLMDIWDPIGVKDEPMAWNEYDGYIGGMFELLWNEASDEALKQFLDGCAAHMGMDSSRHSDQDVIEALRKIDLQRD